VITFAVTPDASSPVTDGYSGKKLIADVRFRTKAGARHARLFVKHCADERLSEARHFRFLAARDVPLPTLYGCVASPDGGEILFMECLDRVGVDWTDGAEVRALLSAMARLNAIDAPPDGLPRWLTGGHAPWLSAIRSVRQHAAGGR
jgi:hypothetical protein